MPSFEIESNGKTFEVEAPDMSAAMNAFKSFSAGGKSPAASAADDASWVGAVDNGVRQIAKGIPVLGGAMDSVAAAGDAATYPLLGRGSEGGNFSERYAKNLTTEQGRDASFEAAHPYIATGLNVAGGVAGTLPLAATALGSRALGMVGSLPARVAQGMAGGAAIGTADATTRGNSIGVGAGMGGLLGGFSPLLGRAAGAAVERFGRSTPQGVAGYEPRAIDKVARAMRDDAVDPSVFQRLGPDAMLVDAGTNLRLQGEALATQPGAASRIVGDAVTGRHKAAADRITQSVDDAIGPYKSYREAQTAAMASRKAEGNRLYGQAFENARPVDISGTMQFLDDELRPRLSRMASGGPAPDSIEGALTRVRSVLGGGNTQRIDARELHTIKLDIEDTIDAAMRNGRKNQAAKLIEVRNRLSDSLDNATDGLYGQARQKFRSDSAIVNALDDGRDLFKKTTRPDDLVAAVRDMSQAEREAFKLGTRDAIDEAMGTAVNDALAARNLFAKDWNKQKLEAVIGKEQADRLFQAIERENAFAATHGAIQRGSQTRGRLAAGREFPNEVSVTNTPEIAGRTILGTAEQGMRAVANALRSNQKSAQLGREAQDAARILTAKGSAREQIAKAMGTMRNQQEMLAPLSKATQDIVTLLSQSQREPLRITIHPRR